MAKVSIALPVHNAAATIRTTLDALVVQTYRDFDVHIIDDASCDDTAQILSEYHNRLNLEIIHAPKNLGISGARNALLASIDAPLVAILDHDDVCHPERLARQAAFMDQNSQIDICGSAITYFTNDRDIGGDGRVLRHPTGDAAIKTTLLYNTAMVHPSAMARRSFFTDVGCYEQELSPAEDYAMWCRAALLGKRFANLEDSLLYYRIHANQTSKVQSMRIVQKDVEIKRFYIRGLLHGADDASLAEFLCPYLQHERTLLATVMPRIFPVILALHHKVPCPHTYDRIISAILASALLRN